MGAAVTRTVLRDWWLPAALTALLLGNAAADDAGYPGAVSLPVAVVLAAVLVLGLRRRHPVAVATTVSALVTGYLLLVQQDLADQPPLEPFLVVLAALFSLGLHASGRDFRLGLATAGTPLLVAELAAAGAGRNLGDVVPTLLFWGLAVVLGRLLHLRASQVERTEQRLADVEQQAALAAEAERTRIARELHDVVAHGLSVVVLHAGVERRLLDEAGSTPGQTRQTLDTIEQTARAALTELRQLLGLLQDRDQSGLLEPLPSLEQLDLLVAPARSAGHEVSLDVRGPVADLPAGIALSAYRIVQEALTNALKHAPGSPIRIRVDRGSDAVSVEVENGAPAAATPHELPSGGHGLPGMRERVRVYGGSLSASAQPDGGFVVRALLPQEAS